MTLAKLDTYDARLMLGAIIVKLDSTNDARAVDILSEIERANNHIYLDGKYFDFLGESSMYSTGDGVFLELPVIRIEQSNIS